MNIEIVYGNAEKQTLLHLAVHDGATARAALQQALPDLNLNENQIGIFGELISADKVLAENDRIEIYQPLKLDPKEARRARVKPLRRKR